MFYAKYVSLCNKAGKSPSAVAEEIGLKRSAVTRWKNGGGVTDATVQRVADYFDIQKEYFLEEKEKAPIQTDERSADELIEYLDMLRTRPECRMLFSLARGATKEDVERAVAIIDALRKKEGS